MEAAAEAEALVPLQLLWKLTNQAAEVTEVAAAVVVVPHQLLWNFKKMVLEQAQALEDLAAAVVCFDALNVENVCESRTKKFESKHRQSHSNDFFVKIAKTDQKLIF